MQRIASWSALYLRLALRALVRPRLAVDLMDERRTGVQRWLFLAAKRPDGGECPNDRAPVVPTGS